MDTCPNQTTNTSRIGEYKMSHLKVREVQPRKGGVGQGMGAGYAPEVGGIILKNQSEREINDFCHA